MALQDKIGRGKIVDKICGLVDSLEKDKNFCLSLNGEWGSGKSFVLSMIEEKLSQKSDYIVIKYDAWENSFYHEPLIAILSCVIDCLEQKLSKMKGYGKVAAEVGKKKSKEIVEKLSESGGKIGFVAKVIKDFIEIIPNLKNVSLATDTKDTQLEIFRSYKSLLWEVKESLNKLTKKVFTENKQTKLVILVDEIDRCLPDEQLKILERLHHLFGVNNCAVIVALNKEQITNTYAKNCGGNGKEYLRKFFDYNFELSMLNTEFFKNELWDNIVENVELKIIQAISKQQVEFLQQYVFEKIEPSFRAQNDIDNRELKRISKHILTVANCLPNKEIDFSYEQQKIADFLDKECGKIEGLKADIQAQIATLEQYKRSVITEAVTHGLNPSAPMKDSGIPWGGEIPEYWKVGRIGGLYELRNQKVSDKDFMPLSVTMKGILPQLETAAKTNDGDNRKLVRAGDFAINSRSDRRGSCGISDYDGSVSLINTILKPRNRMNAKYYNWLFHTPMFADEFYKWGHGIVDDLWTTNWSEMKRISIPLPPLDEQQEIADYLDNKCAEIEQIITDKKTQIETLDGYKKSLIYEYVTGKKEIV